MLAKVGSHLSRHVVGYVALGVALLAGAGLAHSAIPDTTKVIHACYDTADGTLHVIDSETGVRCSRTQTALEWNQAGPAGPPGLAGPPGPGGPPGTGSQTGARPLNDPALRRQLDKSFARKTKKPSPKLIKKLAAAPAAASEARSTFNDELVGLPDFGGLAFRTVASLGLPAGRWVINAKAFAFVEGGTSSPAPPGSWVYCKLQAGADSDLVQATETEGTIALQVVHRFSEPGLVELRCTGSALMAVTAIKITAIRVAKLSNEPTAAEQ